MRGHVPLACVTCAASHSNPHHFSNLIHVIDYSLPPPLGASATAGIISAQLLTWLPRGAGVVNAARGKHLDEAALLAAIDSGAQTTWIV